MSNYLGSAVYSGSGSNNLGPYPPNSSGVNPLTSDIVPNVDNVYDIGQPAKRIKTGYFTDVNADTVVANQLLEAKTFFQAEGPSRFFDTVLFLDNTVGINHTDLTNVGTNTHAQLDTHVGNAAIHFTQAAIDHVNILNKGTNTHAQIDSKLADVQTRTTNIFGPDIDFGTTITDSAAFIGPVTFTDTTTGINHTSLSNTGTNTHAQIDTHLGNATIHYTQAAIDHVNILNKGTNTHAQIDTALSQASSDINILGTRTQNQSAVAFTTTFTNILDLQGTNTYSLKASTANFEIERKGLGDILLYDATTANVTMPIIRGLYVTPANRPIVTSGYTQTATSPTVTNTTVETSIVGTGLGSLTMPANSIVTGSSSRIFMAGFIDINANNEVLTLRLRGGAGGTGGAIALTFPVTIATNLPAQSAWTCEIFLAVRTPANAYATTRATFGSQTFTAIEFATIDTTISNTFTVTAQWGALGASNSINTTQLTTTNFFQPIA